MKIKTAIVFWVFWGLIFFAPVFALAQQTSACGPEANYFYYPQKILFNPFSGFLYVLSTNGLIAVLNEKDLSVVKEFIAASTLPKDFALNSKTGKIYVLDSRPGRVMIYDAFNFSNLGTITIEKNYNPNDVILKKALIQIAVDEDANKIYVLGLDAKLVVINGADNTVEKEYTIPYSINFWPNFKIQKIYLRGGAGFIQELDLKTGAVNPFPIGQYPRDAYVDAANNNVIFIDNQSGGLFVVSSGTKKILKKIDLGLINPRFVSVSERLNLIVVSGAENKINFYDLKSYALLKSVVLPKDSLPERVFFDDARGLTYVPSSVSNVISVINTNNLNIIHNISSGILHDNLFFNIRVLSKEGLITPDGNFYLTYPYSQNISRITPDGQITFVGGFSKSDHLIRYCPADNPVFAGPDFMAFNGDQSKVYVSNRGGFITVLDAKKDEPIKKIDLGGAATRLIYNVKLDRLMVVRPVDSLISIFDGKTDKLLADIKTGTLPLGLIANNLNGDIYVYNATDNFLTVIHPDFSVSKIQLDSLPSGFAYSQPSNRLFVSTQNNADVIDAQSGNTIKSFPDMGKSYLMTAGDNIIFSNSFDNYFTVVNAQSLESRKINFNSPSGFAYNNPSGELFVLDLYGTQIGVFNSDLKLLNIISRSNSFKNFGTSFLTASDKFIYLLDRFSRILQIIDPSSNALVKTIEFNYSPSGHGIDISSWLVDNQNEKLYIASNPYPQVTVLYLADLNKFSAKVITGNMPMTLLGLIVKYWLIILLVVVGIGYAIYRFWYLRPKEGSAARQAPITPNP